MIIIILNLKYLNNFLNNNNLNNVKYKKIFFKIMSINNKKILTKLMIKWNLKDVTKFLKTMQTDMLSK